MNILVSSFPPGGCELNRGTHHKQAICTDFLAVRAASTTNLGVSHEAELLERSAFRPVGACPEKCRCIQ
jgi:hypothetical protein